MGSLIWSDGKSHAAYAQGRIGSVNVIMQDPMLVVADGEMSFRRVGKTFFVLPTPSNVRNAVPRGHKKRAHPTLALPK